MAKRTSERAEVRAKLMAMAKEHGFEISELFGKGSRRGIHPIRFLAEPVVGENERATTIYQSEHCESASHAHQFECCLFHVIPGLDFARSSVTVGPAGDRPIGPTVHSAVDSPVDSPVDSMMRSVVALGSLRIFSGPAAAARSDHRRFRRVVTAPAFRRAVGELSGEQLTRVPRGYLNDHPAAQYLRHRQFIGGREYPADFAVSPRFYSELLTVFRGIAPLVGFLNDAIASRTNDTREFIRSLAG